MKDFTSDDWNALSDDEFRQVVRRFFETHYPDDMRFPSHRLHIEECHDWYRTLSEHGWICPAWPREFGGMGLDSAKQIVLVEEQETYGVARLPDHGIIMVGQLLIQQGTKEQQEKYLPRIRAGEDIWAQGYSEPGSGSDLASLRTAAVLDGDHFVVNGQKTWSTLAQDATHLFMLVRTDPTAKKQEGISFLLVDVTTPGITIRPMATLTGEEDFCDVFFDDVRVPKENLVGEINKGWSVAKSLLGFERLFLGGPKLAQSAMSSLSRLAALTGHDQDPSFRRTFARLKMDVDDLSALYRRFTGVVQAGERLGPDLSILKLSGTELYQKISEVIVEIAGGAAMLNRDVPFDNDAIDVLTTFYNARPATIYGGSSEVQRNIVATGVLGLPRD